MLCRHMGTEIEASMWVLYRESLNAEYKTKFRTLIYNLQDPRNTELRLALLCGAIKPSDLPKRDSMQLAPTELKKVREDRESKYFKEQVLLEGDLSTAKIITKSHKGEMVVNQLDIDDVVKQQKVDAAATAQKNPSAVRDQTEAKEKDDSEAHSMTEGDAEAWPADEGREAEHDEDAPSEEENKAPAPTPMGRLDAGEKSPAKSPSWKARSPGRRATEDSKKADNKVGTEAEEVSVGYYAKRLAERYRNMLGGDLGAEMEKGLAELVQKMETGSKAA